MTRERFVKRVVISGATGAIGIALIQLLIEHGVYTVVLCHSESFRNDRIPEDPLVRKVNCSLEQMEEYQVDETEPFDIFFHLAWAGTSGIARNDMYLQNKNVKYALDAVNLAHRFGCKKFVGVGSQAEYGRHCHTLAEDTPTVPENGYGIAKLCAGRMTAILADQLGMEHNWVRVLSVYGPFDGENTLVMSVIRQLLSGNSPKVTACQQIWDFLYCTDAATALFLVAEKGVNCKVYVLGGGEERPLSEYVEIIRDNVNSGGTIEYGAIPYDDKQVMYLHGNISEIREDTGYTPKVSFEEGIRQTIQWVKGNIE